MKKAQLMSQPFYYIFIVIVIALIFLFGFNIINNLIKLNENAKYVTFKTDFEQAVNDMYYKNPGSIINYTKNSNHKPLVLPKDVKEVCFIKNGLTRVKASSLYFREFSVNNLVPEIDCIKSQSNSLSFTLENKLINNEIKVVIR